MLRSTFLFLGLGLIGSLLSAGPNHVPSFDSGACRPLLSSPGKKSTVQLFLGEEKDFIAIKKIASQYGQEMGQIYTPNLQQGLKEKSLVVAKNAAREVIGFILWHSRKDGWNTVYELAVARSSLRQGIGARLLSEVPRPRKLQTVSTNIRSHEFYRAEGLVFVGKEPSAHRNTILYNFEDPMSEEQGEIP